MAELRNQLQRIVGCLYQFRVGKVASCNDLEGKERKGKERKGRERKGKERKGGEL